MKKLYFLLILLIMATSMARAQVGINANNSAPDPSAMLDVKSTTKGVLVPRMTAAERDLIVSPAIGLMIFCTDNNQFYANKGTSALPNWMMITSQWLQNGNDIWYSTGNVGIGTTAPHAMLQFSNALANRKIVMWDAANNNNQYYGFGMNNSTLRYQVNDITSRHVFYAGCGASCSVELMRIHGNGTVGIGTSTPAAAALLDVVSTTKGFLPPRMTTTQRDAITQPAAGLTIYNISKNCNETYNGSSWASNTHYIGESYEGGIVFYVSDYGQHGLIATTTDQSTGLQWYNGTFRKTGTTGIGAFAGAMNTALIIAQQMTDNQNGNFAAKLCADWQVTVGGYFNGDWYLPSKNELALLYLQKTVVGGFDDGDYWSSSEYDATTAWALDFTNGVNAAISKNGAQHVRAVRAF